MSKPIAAFPQIIWEYSGSDEPMSVTDQSNPGMSLRDYFAAHCQADDRLVKCIRAMDDRALELFALHPDAEREEHITEIEFTAFIGTEVQKVAKRLLLEARAIARVRFMQADAMLAERAKEPAEPVTPKFPEADQKESQAFNLLRRALWMIEWQEGHGDDSDKLIDEVRALLGSEGGSK